MKIYGSILRFVFSQKVNFIKSVVLLTLFRLPCGLMRELKKICVIELSI